MEHCTCGAGFRELATVALDGSYEYYRVCKNPRCPRLARCAECGEPLRPVTDPAPELQSRCVNPTCKRFEVLVGDNWSGRFAA